MTGSFAPTHSPPSPSTRHNLTGTVLSCVPRCLQRNVDLTGYPKTMEQNGELSRDCHDGSLLSCFATSCMLHAPPTQIGVWSAVTEDVVRAVNQEHSQVLVAGL